MAEILRITTPLVNKNNPTQLDKPVTDPTVPFHLQDVQTVPKMAQTQEQILQQHNGLVAKENSPDVLTGLLKDPAAAVSFVKNIYVLQEIIKLLPANNSPITQEIEQMFHSLFANPEEIAGEMARQGDTATAFRGDLFTYLRTLIAQKPSADIYAGVANLLKSINSLVSRQDALNAVANSLQYLSESMAPSKTLAGRLAELSAAFRGENAAEQFTKLKAETLALLKEVEGSLLFSPKLDKVSSITLYNLSRFNDNPDFFREAVNSLWLALDSTERQALLRHVASFREELKEQAQQSEMSKIMDVLTRVIRRQAQEGANSSAIAEKVEKIIYSLLSSPCHFTPLLHFVIPVQYDMLKAFAEIWINPNGEEDLRGEEANGKPCSHMLLVFDIEGIGQFEVDLYAIDKKISISLYCPPAYTSIFASVTERFYKCLANTSYTLDKIQVERLDKPRSLMDVFKSLPYKRTGVDVKI